MLKEYLQLVLKAQVYDVAEETPIDKAKRLSSRFQNNILLKREDLQPVFSFKLRGAYNKIASLSKSEQKKGVIASSAGNHAQGIALSVKKLGLNGIIVMPSTTPAIKVSSVHNLGGKTILYGDTYDDAYLHAKKLAKEKDMIFIHPYDDPYVIAGQGTIAMEILRQTSDIHAIFVPVGGGGLIAGIAVYIKSLWPKIKIIGVEPDDAPCLHEALSYNKRIILPQVGIFADGVAVRQVGKEPFKIAKKYVDDVILVNTDEICAAIKDIFDDTRSIVEPAGALAIAGLKKYVKITKVKNKNLVAINSGANINFDRLKHVAERAELGEHNEAFMAVTIDERPGSFLQFCNAIGTRGITEFNYRYSNNDHAHVFVGIRLNEGEKEKLHILKTLESMDYPVIDLSNNEVAKIHICHMVGGHAPDIKNEKIYRFEFPERPGALLKFLTNMGQRWNISLFHYRNYGADYGRVLVGIQVPDKEIKEFNIFLNEVGYSFWEETENLAYKLFLG